MSIAITLIIGITALAWILARLGRIDVCPVCAGVSGAWLLMTIGVLLGYVSLPEVILPLAILMGGTVVGIAYMGGERMPVLARWGMWKWKVPVIVFGFAGVYWLLGNISWEGVIAEVLVLAAVAYAFFFRKERSREEKSPIAANQNVDKLMKDMDQCC
ncbi:hypothetical protein C4587_02290 [Candidatus Parcubacteria bacterium]|nr:MAG: hypothetical protein C4587_02290 [Candidatus Parcubacteria bacterium]